MKPTTLAVALTLCAGSASADCASMWLTRNMVFDRAGYCFGSTLGQSVFDNTGCVGTDVTLSPSDADFVAQTRRVETEYACEVDTTSSRLSLDNLGHWRALEDLPLRDIGESGCIGWTGPDLPLRAGANDISSELGKVRLNDTLLFRHIDRGDYTFVEVTRDGAAAAIGWFPTEFIGPLTCEQLAG